MAEDYYKVLGIQKSANKADIKKAYKKMAMKFHPDRNKGDKGAEEKFKKVNEAYAVLSDEQKRMQYDQYGAEGFSNRFSQEDIFKGFDFGNIFGGSQSGFGGDMFSSIFGGQSSRSQGNPFSFNFGGGGSPFGQSRAHRGGSCGGGCAPKPKQKPAETELTVSLKEAYNGTKKNISFNFGQGIDKIVLHVPAGIDNGQKLKLKGKGKMSPMSGSRGDLYVKIKILPDATFKREGNDLIIEQEIPITGLIQGTTFIISTIDDKKVEMKVPPFTKNNSVLRIKGKGFSNGKDTPGNLLIRLSAAIPTELTEKQKELISALSETGL